MSIRYRRSLLAQGIPNFKLKTFLGTETPGYPVGVFNVSGNYIGKANNQGDYVTLWNSDPANQAVCTIAAGSTSTSFTTSTNADPGLIGLRYWQVDAALGNTIIFGKHDKLLTKLSGGTIINGTDVPEVTSKIWTYSFSGISGSWTGFNRQQPRRWWRTNGTLSPNSGLETVTVFHNDDDSACGVSSSGNDSELPGNGGSGLTYNLYGNFPKHTPFIMMKLGNNQIVSNNIGFNNILNWSELIYVKKLLVMDGTFIYSSTGYNNTALPLFTHMTQLEDLSMWGVQNFSYYQVNKTNFPNMTALSMGGFQENLSTYDFSTIPNLTKQFVIYSPQTTHDKTNTATTFAAGHTYTVSAFTEGSLAAQMPQFGFQMGGFSPALVSQGWTLF